MKAILRVAAEKLALARLKRRCHLTIGSGSRVNFRSLSKCPPAKLSIGEDSIFEGSIAADHPAAIVTIGNNTFVGRSRLICAERIEIGNDVLIAWGCTLVDHDSHSPLWDERQNDVRDWHRDKKVWSHVARKKIVICDKAWIGFNSIILKGVTVGAGAVVGAGSVVSRDVDPYTVVVGNPAKPVKRLNDGRP